MAYIYSITNTINKKAYVGLTRKDNPTDRWKRHIKNASEDKLDYPIYLAMRKYGTHNFRFKILEECAEDKVAEREIHFIKELNTYGDAGYNATPGGEGWNNKELKSIGITSYTMEGEKIKDYDSMTDASEDLNIKLTCISRVVSGKQCTASNLRFSKQGEEPVPIRTNKGARNKTAIYGYNKEGEYKEWDSMYQFAKDNGIGKNSTKGIYNSIRSDNSNKKQCRGWYLFEKTDTIIKWGEFSLSQHFRWTSDEYRKRVNYDAKKCSELGKIGATKRWNNKT
jgi:hypothetical protein